MCHSVWNSLSNGSAKTVCGWTIWKGVSDTVRGRGEKGANKAYTDVHNFSVDLKFCWNKKLKAKTWVHEWYVDLAPMAHFSQITFRHASLGSKPTIYRSPSSLGNDFKAPVVMYYFRIHSCLVLYFPWKYFRIKLNGGLFSQWYWAYERDAF